MAFGVAMMLYGYGQLREGHFAYINGFWQLQFSAGVIAIGAFSFLLAFVPVSWVARLIPERHQHLVLHHRYKRQPASDGAKHS